jgi:hypothetical protein
MTEASVGLRKALARKAGVSKLSPEELLAEMSDEQKTALAASLARAPSPSAVASEDTAEDHIEEVEDGADEPKSKKKDKEYMDEDAKAKAATERAVAVMSSEHVAGRTKLAADLLANDKLSADEIISILSASAPATTTDPEDAARAEMQAALQEAGNSAVEANDSGAAAQAADSAVWDKTYAKLGYIKPAA